MWAPPMIDAAAARRNMVNCQIRPNKVTDLRVIEAFESVAREGFVPDSLTSVAYLDADLEIAPGRFLMEPMVMARLIQAVEPEPDDRVLDVGTGRGYAAAVLARLAGRVVALECEPGLADAARKALAGIGNVTVVTGALADGHAAGAPYDIIFIGGAVDRVPGTLLDQLAEGGRLAVVTHHNGMGEASLYLKRGGAVSHRGVFEAATPRLPGFASERRFEF